jgi:hypothetical protein
MSDRNALHMECAWHVHGDHIGIPPYTGLSSARRMG